MAVEVVSIATSPSVAAAQEPPYFGGNATKEDRMRSARTARHVALGAACLLVVAVGMTPAAATHGGSGSPELPVVGHLGPADLGFFGENITDVWAARSSNGRDYAYLGSFDDVACTLDTTGTRIVDITDPESPAQVAFLPDRPGARTNDVKVAHLETPFFTGELLVETNEPCGSLFFPRLNGSGAAVIPGQGGIALWDVTDPTKPRSLKQNFLKNGVHNTYIWQDGDNAYLIAVDDVAIQDVIVVDITKPQSPKVIAVTGQQDWPAGIDNIGDGEVFLHDVWVQGGIAYLSYWDAGLVLLDVSDPANPVFLGDSDYADPDPLSGRPPEGNSHVSVPNASGTRVLMGDEDFAAGSLTSFEFEGTPYPAGMALFGPIVDPSFTGPVHWTGGEGCTTGEYDRAAVGTGEIALVQRGTCFFTEKAKAAQDLGYAGYVVANDAARGDGVINMSAGTNDVITIPGFFVGFSTGEIMKANEGGTLFATGVFDGYGYLRLLDVTIPGAIVELDQFATEHVFDNPPLPGDRTMHNVVVDGGTTAYISWYAEGIRVVDFSGDSLTEVAHFVDTGAGSNFWGVYLYDHSDGNTYVLGSDRATGLWIFETP